MRFNGSDSINDKIDQDKNKRIQADKREKIANACEIRRKLEDKLELMKLNKLLSGYDFNFD
jgi:hypothetical protein